MNQIELLMDILCRRRSVRRYQPGRPVEHDKITLLLKAAMAAPSACNLQPWEFIVVDNPDALDKLKDSIHPEHGRSYNAPAAIVVCSNTNYIPWEGDGAMDCSAAIENMLLAATAMGLGAVWIGAADSATLRQLFDIPAPVAVISVVLVGYPAEEKPPRTQYTEEAIYWQKYDPQREHPPRSTDLRFL